MLSQSTLLAQPNVRRGVTALLAIGVICSIPWTVTAQKAPAAPPAPAHKKTAAKHHASTAPSKKTSPASVSYFIDERSGSLYMVTTTAHKTLTYKIGTHPKVGKASTKPNAPTVIRYYALPTPTGAAAFPTTGTLVAPAAPGVVRMIMRPGAAVAAPAYGVTVAGNPSAALSYGVTLSGAAPDAARTISTLVAPPRSVVNRSGVAVLTSPPPPRGAITSISAPAATGASVSAVNIPPAQVATDFEPAKARLVTGNGSGDVTMDLHETDVITALRAVLKEAGVDFAIKSTVEHDKITCGAKNVSWRTALQAIFAAARQNLTFREEGGVIVVFPKD